MWEKWAKAISWNIKYFSEDLKRDMDMLEDDERKAGHDKFLMAQWQRIKQAKNRMAPLMKKIFKQLKEWRVFAKVQKQAMQAQMKMMRMMRGGGPMPRQMQKP